MKKQSIDPLISRTLLKSSFTVYITFYRLCCSHFIYKHPRFFIYVKITHAIIAFTYFLYPLEFSVCTGVHSSGTTYVITILFQ